MIKTINFYSYKKLKDIDLNFDNKLNFIAGTNGTGKSTILHVIANSFKKPVAKANVSVPVISHINEKFNPKIETLARDTKRSAQEKGNFYTVTYSNGATLTFRKHEQNSPMYYRYSVKPLYKKGLNESLPSKPVIYLGLSRLVNIGEIDDNFYKESNLKQQLPSTYQKIRDDLYKKFTGITIVSPKNQSVSAVKNRLGFETNKTEIDSNTISSGEDNLLIILNALISLQFYWENLSNEEKKEETVSLLLVDEIDATLHPYFLKILIELMVDYSRRYRIQMFFTTHSLFLLELALNKNMNVIYLLNNIDRVNKLEEITYQSITNQLQLLDPKNTDNNKKIAVFTEDEEARILFLNFCAYAKNNFPETVNALNCFHLVPCKIGCTNLLTIFSNDYVTKSLIRSICVLDGDQKEGITETRKKELLEDNITFLVGDKSPEILLIEFGISEYNNKNSGFFNHSQYTKEYFRVHIQDNYDSIIEKEKKGELESGSKRRKVKEIFTTNITLLTELFRYWLEADENKDDVVKLIHDLRILFKRTATLNGIDPNLWE